MERRERRRHDAAGALWSGANAVDTMRLAADDVTGFLLDDWGHYPAEEQPARFAEILRAFLRGEAATGEPRS